MKLSLLTWNSQNIASSTLNAVIPLGQLANLSATAITVPRSGDFPFLSTTNPNGHVFVIEVYVAKTQNINTARELVKQYFNIIDQTRHNLVAQDEADSNKQYYLTGFPIGISPLGGNEANAFNVRLQVEYPYWQLVTATSDSWDITASGDSDPVTNSGNINVPPIFTITPITTKTKGLKYWRYVPIYNNLDKSFVAPLDITNGGLDVQSLINAGKMQASGNDLRVWSDGSFSDRWLHEVDSDSDPGFIWVNYNLSSRKEAVTLSTFDSDDTTISFTQTRASKQFLQSLKQTSNYTLFIESEAITFDPDNIDLINYQITSLGRGKKYTTAVSHSASSTVRYIEHDLWIMYGDSDLGSPDVDDDYKPIFNLSSSNQIWSYTNFFDNDSNRSGMWNGGVSLSKTGLSYVFTADENTFADPSTELGLALLNYPDSRVQFEIGTLAWTFSHPSGITDVDYDGAKYFTDSDSDATSWPAIVGLQYLQSNAAWFTAQNEDMPTLAFTWETFSHTVDLVGTYDAIRFAIDGALDPNPNEMAMAQFDTVSLTFDSDNLTTISVGSENSINFFDFKLTNATTGEYILVTTPCPLNQILTIDCVNKEAYLEDGSRVNVRLSTDRDAWLDLQPGVNNLNYVDVGTVAVHINIVHRDRIL